MESGVILTTVSIGSVSAFLLQIIKWGIRKAKKDSAFDFPPLFYAFSIPVLNFLLTPLMALVGFEGFSMPADWHGWVLGAIRVVIGSLVSLGTYTVAIEPLKNYNKQYELMKGEAASIYPLRD